ncbi:MAG TPA: hypothetical protein VFK45_05630 [Gammaproteobacteria bacterium]|nr:hypothetical protein [Gammaproteobacteria bacterium]
MGAGFRPGGWPTFVSAKVGKTMLMALARSVSCTSVFPKIGLKIGAGTELSPPSLRTLFLVFPIFNPIFGCAQIAGVEPAFLADAIRIRF